MATSVPSASLDLSPEHNLTRYLQKIRKFPFLTHDQELLYARRWRDLEDDEAAAHMVNAHLRLVAKIAMGYRGYGMPVAELISEGNIGMMQAVKKFDPEKGFRLSTYAMWWIRAAIQEYILHSSSMVKMGTTAAQKKLFFNLRRLKGQMQAYEDGDLLPEHVKDIADRLNVPETEVVSMNRRMAGPDSSLNSVVNFDGTDEWIDWLKDETQDNEERLGDFEELVRRRSLLSGAIKTLTERERTILTKRRLEESPSTLENLSQDFGISRERVRQIEERAFIKIQKSVKNAVIEQKIAV